MLTPKQYYWRLIFERIIGYLKIACFISFTVISIQIILIPITEEKIPDKLNKCLKTHTLDYCNNTVK